jgi:GT2 family glycosyltransferase
VSRPTVSVVMPFAGSAADAYAALGALRRLELRDGDELILADNTGVAPSDPGVRVIRAGGERSPAHARNAGAEHASGDWILFLDADCRAPHDLLDTYFAEPVGEDVGALAGEVAPAGDARTLAERYGVARSFLSQEAHLAHPYLPRAVAANLLVRRAAFEQVGGFYEGVRAAEDTDFSWRLQRAGWRLELRPDATVEHRYRTTLRELRSQWRGYAAGRAWLRRRYEGFQPEPAVQRGARRALGRVRRKRGRPATTAAVAQTRRRDADRSAVDRAQFLALDVLLAAEELAGFTLSNRPERGTREPAPGRVVLIADRFPVEGDPFVDFARTLRGARVEASSRPEAPWLDAARELEFAYREDDGAAARVLATGRLAVRHPIRVGFDVVGRRGGEPSLVALAPAAMRLEREPGARLHALRGDEPQRVGRRLAALTGRGITET